MPGLVYDKVLQDDGEPCSEYQCKILWDWNMEHNDDQWEPYMIATKVCADLEMQQWLERRRFPIAQVVDSLFRIHRFMDKKDEDEQRKLAEMIPYLNQRFLQLEPALNEPITNRDCGVVEWMATFHKVVKDNNLNRHYIVSFECPSAKTWAKQNWPGSG